MLNLGRSLQGLLLPRRPPRMLSYFKANWARVSAMARLVLFEDSFLAGLLGRANPAPWPRMLGPSAGGSLPASQGGRWRGRGTRAACVTGLSPDPFYPRLHSPRTPARGGNIVLPEPFPPGVSGSLEGESGPRGQQAGSCRVHPARHPCLGSVPGSEPKTLTGRHQAWGP